MGNFNDNSSVETGATEKTSLLYLHLSSYNYSETRIKSNSDPSKLVDLEIVTSEREGEESDQGRKRNKEKESGRENVDNVDNVRESYNFILFYQIVTFSCPPPCTSSSTRRRRERSLLDLNTHHDKGIT